LRVLNILEEYEIHPEEMMVIYDDLDLPLGRMRLRLEGSSGGHHGVESIIKEIKTENFVRLRIGIGRPKDKNKVVNYVLSPFSPEEEPLLYAVLGRASECILRCLETSPQDSMSFCNAHRWGKSFPIKTAQVLTITDSSPPSPTSLFRMV
jgi:PTH1 family peptidyl-tRNA hydrolase